jgi:hypothetical protein
LCPDHLTKGELDAPILGYAASVEAARQALKAAQNALCRDVGQAITQANWPYLRDRHDVAALVDYITEAADSADFVSKLQPSPIRHGRRNPSVAGRPKAQTEALTRTK